jgi:4-diphosphocytidyl-2-C-methyl-D-erythritol kinase
MASRGLEISAPGKINLILRILDRRSDRYHNLWSLIQAVELADTVTIEASNSGRIVLSCDGAPLPEDSQNLAYRAAAAALAKTGCAGGVRIHIQKRVPVAAGMGGGSSDAAAAIRGVGALFDTRWTPEEMNAIGRDIGSDVPVFFYGPTALVEGRGERVTPLTPPPVAWIVLVNPGISIPTAWAYEQLAETRKRTEERVSPPPSQAVTPECALNWQVLLQHVQNDFGPVMEDIHPVLRDIRVRLLEQGALVALLSGSGSTVFGVYPTEDAAASAKCALETPGWRVWMTRTRQVQDSPRTLN